MPIDVRGAASFDTPDGGRVRRWGRVGVPAGDFPLPGHSGTATAEVIVTLRVDTPTHGTGPAVRLPTQRGDRQATEKPLYPRGSIGASSASITTAVSAPLRAGQG